ncbi:MAG: YncE family protein [Sphingobium sp.]
MTSVPTGLRRATLALMTAGSLMVAGAAIAQASFGALDSSSEARVSFSGTERGKPIQAGGEVAVSGQGFRPGQQVTLLYGSSAIEGGALTADAEGKVAGKFTVPANAVSGNHPIVVVAQAPYYATVSDLKISPTIPLSGQKNYIVTEAQAARGLYQSAYSAKNNTLFVTSAVGRPPVHQSELVKLDADSLKVLARVTPQTAPERERPAGPAPAAAPGRPGAPGGAEAPQGPGVFAVYGVDVDDAKGTVWVTNTRQNTVAVYRQSDLSLVKQFEPGAVGHPRDARVDSALGKAYVSASGKPEVAVFDTGSLTAAKTIPIRALGRGKEFSAARLSLDTAAHKLYVVSLSTGEVAVIDTRTDAVEKVIPVPGVRSAIGVSHDPQTGRIFVAAQGSDNLVVLDGTSGKVIADTPIGAGALNVAFDPVKRRAYVSNRGAGTIAVTDADGKLLANLGPAPSANHVALGKNGTVFAVDKSANARDAESDTIIRIRPKG